MTEVNWDSIASKIEFSLEPDLDTFSKLASAKPSFVTFAAAELERSAALEELP